MSWAQLAHTIFMAVYTFSLVMVSVYGIHRYVIVYLYYRHRKKAPQLASCFRDLPRVTVQLPMYNETRVAQRIIERTCEMDYPREKLQIQVVDDSTDETTAIARRTVEDAKARGFDIEYVHRTNREGYKAGALANGMDTATGEFIAIFDADFVPDPSFLKRSIHYFTDPKVCVVQTRWDHLNREDSLLTRSQAIFLDGHFAIEHVARNRSKRFMSFNGTAGTWRRSAIEDAGGWNYDTLTEDLDLSYRAQLKGWKFIFLPELKSPAELPPEMNAFRAQQFRWTKGGAQTALKLMPRIFLSKAPLKVKIESFFHLTSFTMHLYVMILLLSMFPALYLRTIPMAYGTFWRGAFDMAVFTLATLSASVFYLAGQFELFRDWRASLKYLPVLMALAVGLCLSNARAVCEALLGKQSEFVRTPKYGGTKSLRPTAGKKRKRKILPYIEFLFGVYMLGCAIASIINFRAVLAAPFLIVFAFGFFFVSTASMQASRAAKAGDLVGQPASTDRKI